MGTFTVRFLSQGKDINMEHWNRDWEHAYDLAARYNIQEINKLKFEGENFTLDFDISQLKEEIHWEAASYPSEKVKLATIAIVSFEPIRRKLTVVKEKIQHCQFESRSKLDTLGWETLAIIEKATLSEGAPHLKGAKEEAEKAIKHSLGKEVNQAVHLKKTSRTSQRSIDLAMKEAQFYLIRDIDFFLQSATIRNLS